MEGNVDAFEGDGGEAAFEIDGLGFGGGLLGGFADDFNEVGFHVFHGKLFGESLDVDVLGLDVIGHVGETVEGAELDN